MKLLIVTDAWTPQVNGVVRTLKETVRVLSDWGHAVEVLSPDGFASVPCPTYPEIPLALFPGRAVARRIDASAADAVHIATEGPLGLAARRHCLKRGLAFTTAYHTAFPEYVTARTGLPVGATYRYMRWFHGPSAGVMVATESLHDRLLAHGFGGLRYWSRGVDAQLFRPGARAWLDAPRPVLLYAGRVVVDKNVEAFLALDVPGTKYVVGPGPQLAQLRRRYPAARFTGYVDDATLARYYAAADVFVFPSRTDTFGLVLLEALASGLPVAAYPVTGPLEIVGTHGVGRLDEDLAQAVAGALALSGPHERCRARALAFTWEDATRDFLGHLRTAASERAAA